MATTNYSWNLPTVGGSEDTWGTDLNANWTALDTLLNGVTQAEISLLKGQTSLVPAGVIVMWSGSVASIPSGWYLCDGNNGTPDLRNRFVVGAGDSYAVDDTGGADSVTLTESQIPGHTHTFTGTTSTDGAHTHTANSGFDFITAQPASGRYGPGSIGGFGGGLTTNGDHNHTVSGTTDSTGGGSSHENRPPYYALAYIMKA